jgi:hypothetical protein
VGGAEEEGKNDWTAHYGFGIQSTFRRLFAIETKGGGRTTLSALDSTRDLGSHFAEFRRRKFGMESALCSLTTSAIRCKRTGWIKA